MNLLKKFQTSLSKLAPEEATFLLAVSGGMDSCVMAEFFHRSGKKCIIAHCNYQLRDEDSRLDAIHVQQLANRLGYPVYINTFETEHYATAHHLSIQMAARKLRYDWFKELQKEYNCKYIVTAHHAGDQAETMLLNLAKGRSVQALSGIPSVNNSVIRPLLEFTKEELLNFSASHNINWREDISNISDDYERNYIRHSVIPRLQEINPGLFSSMQQSSNLLKEAAAFISNSFEIWKQKYCKEEKDSLFLNDLHALKEHPLLQNFIFLILQPFAFTPAVIRQITGHLDAQSGVTYHSHTHHLTFDRNSFWVLPSGEKPEKEYIIEGTGVTNADDFIISIEETSSPDFQLPPNIAFVDAAKLHFPLKMRHWKKGDSFIPLGMNNHKKLSDFFIDQKVPLPLKSRIWLLTSNDEIAWIAGYRLDQRFALTGASKTILKITFAAP
jgi:tRNA(Ile)-lysidine synthase